MLLSELPELIARGEGFRLGFKRGDEHLEPETVAKEIVAFANTRGGIILIGVEDNGDISGIRRESLQAWLMDTVMGRYVRPYVDIEYEEIPTDDGTVAVIEVPEGNAKPHVVRSKHRADIYVRSGPGCQLASREQIVRLSEAGGLLSVEQMPAHGSFIEDLDERRCREYLADHLRHTEKELEDVPGLLATHKFLVGESPPLRCSYDGCALFGKFPQRKLPQAGLRLTVYAGADKSFSPRFDHIYDLPLVEYRGELRAPDPIDPALHQSTRLQEYISREQVINRTRRRIWDYPEEAVQELIINALIHRDWTKQDCVRVVAYSDRLEVISPGALPNGLTVDDIKRGASHPRNPVMVRVFGRYGYLEGQGMGIRLKVIPLMRRANGRDPEFEATEQYFKVTLRQRQSADALLPLSEQVTRVRNLFRTEMDECEREQELVLPLLRALGWGGDDAAEVRLEHHSGGQRIDIALLAHDQPAVFIEVLGTPADDWSIRQESRMVDWCRAEDRELLGVLTNGLDWHVFAISGMDEKKYSTKRIDIARGEASEAAEQLAQSLSRSRVAAS